MKMKKIAALILAVLMIVCALAACTKKVKVNGRFRDYFSTMPPTLNRFTNDDTATSSAYNLITAYLYNTIYTKDGKGFEWESELAADFPKQADSEGKVWNIPIRKNLKWSNGDPIDAHTFEYGVKMCIDPLQLNLVVAGITNSDYAKMVNCVEYRNQNTDGTTVSWDQVGCKAIDDYTLQITLEKAVPQMNVIMYASSFRPIHQGLYEAGMSADGTTTDYGTAVDKILSCGKFILKEWVPDAKMTFDRNPDYVFADRISLEGYDYIVVKDTSTAIELFQTGQIDRVGIAYTDWPTFEDDPRVHEYFNDSLMYMMINTGNPDYGNVLGKKDFRLALFYSIDRQKLADTLGVYPATRLCRKAVIGDNLTGTPFVDLPQNFVKTAAEAFNVNLANEYLTKAYEQSKINSVSLAIVISETATHIKGACEIIMKQWEDNFKGKLAATIRPLPASQAQSARRWHEDDPTSFELALGSLLPSATNVRNTFKYYISTYNPPRVNWHSDEYDALYDATQGLDQYNPDDIKIIAEKCLAMEKILLDEVVVNPVYERPEKVLIADNVHLPVPGYIVGYGLGYTYSTID